LGHFETIWDILYSFVRFSGFGIMYQEKSGNPARDYEAALQHAAPLPFEMCSK
jgi:hypothetical protein